MASPQLALTTCCVVVILVFQDADVDEDEVVEQKDRDELMDIAEWKVMRHEIG